MGQINDEILPALCHLYNNGLSHTDHVKKMWKKTTNFRVGVENALCWER